MYFTNTKSKWIWWKCHWRCDEMLPVISNIYYNGFKNTFATAQWFLNS